MNPNWLDWSQRLQAIAQSGLAFTRVMPSQIARLFAHRRHPEWPTDFD